MDQSAQNNMPTPLASHDDLKPTPFPKPASFDPEPPKEASVPTSNEVPTSPTTPEPASVHESASSQSESKENYRKKLVEELAKLDKIYEGEFTGSIATKDGSSNALFLKEPPVDTPDFLKEGNDQMKDVSENGLVGFIPGNSLVIIKGEAAVKLYKYFHAEDKKRFGAKFETSVGNIDYSYDKPDLKTLADLLADKDPDKLLDVNVWNLATKTTAEIAEMKKFVLREEKVEEAIQAAYETTAKLAEKAA